MSRRLIFKKNQDISIVEAISAYVKKFIFQTVSVACFSTLEHTLKRFSELKTFASTLGPDFKA
jgi:hypothetical protein